MFRKSFTYTSLILVVLSIITSCGGKEKVVEKSTFVMTDTMYNKCEFAPVEYKTVQSDLKLFGKVTADNNRSANVFSVMGGSVEKLYVELGDYVKQGQMLATLKSADVTQIQQQRLTAISNVALAKKNLQVAKDLYDSKLTSEKDVIAAQRDLDLAEAELQRVNDLYSIYSLGSNSTYNIKAPISGYIIVKNITPNEVLNKDGNDLLFSISEIKDIWVVANVNESDIPKVKLGYEADVKTISYPDRIYEGKIDKIFNVIDPVTKALQIVIKIPNTDMTLKPEMSTTVHVHYDEDEKMLAVPSSAIIFDENKYWVVVFRSKTDMEVRQVDMLKDINGNAFLKSGVKKGEKVISKNGLFIYDALTD